MGEILEIELSRGQSGLGFNIKGGVDIPHIRGDAGIFVAKVRDKGAAADDGRMKEGDKIIEINGHNVEKVQHKEAVAYFLNSGDTVKLKIIQGAEAVVRKQMASAPNNFATRPGSINTTRNNSSSAISGRAVFIGLAALGIAVFIAYRYKR